jgi:hypothetical protein
MKRAALFLAALSALSCGAKVDDSALGPTTPSVRPRASFAIQTRDRKVSWLVGASPSDRRFRVEDAQGALIADGVNLDELRRIDPFLSAACTSAVAGHADGPYLDARLDRPVTHADRAITDR